MNFAVVVFPGSNCDRDCHHVLRNVLKQDVQYVWHKETRLPKVDCVVLPGGFSYGDYLRCGAIARFSPIMPEIKSFADRGGYVIGICNGFQILTESGLLPGALLRNRDLHFICDTLSLKVTNPETPFTRSYVSTPVVRMPIAHMDGNYFIEADGLKSLQDHGQIVFQYSDPTGAVTEASNPNGAVFNISGIVNRKKNVLGMMPHPERVSEGLLGGEDGKGIFLL